MLETLFIITGYVRRGRSIHSTGGNVKAGKGVAIVCILGARAREADLAAIALLVSSLMICALP